RPVALRRASRGRRRGPGGAEPLLRRHQHGRRGRRRPRRSGRGRLAGRGPGEGPMSARLAVALLGAGRLGAAHARTLASLPEVHLAVVADPAPAARELGARFGARALADPRAAIQDPAIDAVVIVTPTGTHAEL